MKAILLIHNIYNEVFEQVLRKMRSHCKNDRLIKQRSISLQRTCLNFVERREHHSSEVFEVPLHFLQDYKEIDSSCCSADRCFKYGQRAPCERVCLKPLSRSTREKTQTGLSVSVLFPVHHRILWRIFFFFNKINVSFLFLVLLCLFVRLALPKGEVPFVSRRKQGTVIDSIIIIMKAKCSDIVEKRKYICNK